MLLTAPTTSTKLPVDLTFAYASYKRGTRKLVSWLASASKPAFTPCSPQSPVSPLAAASPIANPTSSGLFFTIDDLRALADIVIAHAVNVPEDVLFTLHTTLEARECMSCWYQKVANQGDEEANDGHAFFNATLRSIYKDLRGASRRTSGLADPKKSAVSCDASAICQDEDAVYSNSFSCLHIYDSDEGSPETSGLSTANTKSAKSVKAESKAEFSGGNQPSLKDDSLEQALCIHMYQDELSRLSELVNDTNYKAGRGMVPMIVASTITRLAYFAARKLSANLSDYSIKTPQDLQNALTEHSKQLRITSSCQHDGSSESSIVEDVKRIWQTVSQFKQDLVGSAEEKQTCTCEDGSPSGRTACAFQNAHEWFGLDKVPGSAAPADPEVNQACLETMLRTMVLRIKQMRQAQPGRYYCMQLLADLECFFRQKVPTNACHLSFGLHLLVTSYRSYLLGTTQQGELSDSQQCVEQKTKSWRSVDVNPRLMSLKLASTIKNEIKTTMTHKDAPCVCLKMNGISVTEQISSVYNKLESFLATPRFELLIQSTWISGEHMLEHLVLSSRYGFKAWHHGYYCGLIFHTYNALVQTGNISPDAIPVLEDLCNLFINEVFLGSRTSSKTYSAYKRWSGGHLKFVGHHRKGGSRDWDMCIAADPSKGGDKVCRSFVPSKISLFALLTENKDVVDLDVVERVVEADPGMSSEAQSTGHTVRRDAVRLRSEILSGSGGFASYIGRIQQVLETEFSTACSEPDTPVCRTRKSPLAVALINPFIIYRKCLETLGSICDSTHPPADHGTLCRCMPQRCLAACEQWLVANKSACSTSGRMLMQDKETVQICKEQLIRGFGALKREDIIWKI